MKRKNICSRRCRRKGRYVTTDQSFLTAANHKLATEQLTILRILGAMKMMKNLKLRLIFGKREDYCPRLVCAAV